MQTVFNVFLEFFYFADSAVFQNRGRNVNTNKLIQRKVSTRKKR